MYKSKVLVVEDNTAISNLIRTTLETKEYQYHTAQNGSGALTEVVSPPFGCGDFRFRTADMDGVDIIKEIRSFSTMPIIVVSARTEDQDKVDALDARANDYLTKPFNIDEFLARLRVALRRSHTEGAKPEEESSVYVNGNLKIDYAAGCVYVDSAEVHLTPIEYKLLCLLIQNTGKVLTHNYILKEVWGSTLASDIPSLRVFMATLRKKIEKSMSSPQCIQPHIGVGYRMIRQ